MRTEIKWLTDALSTKDIVTAMTHYRVKDKIMMATNGRLVASHPTNIEGEFLVPGKELEAIYNRLADEPTVKMDNGKVQLRSGRFSGSLETLPSDEWNEPVVPEIKWKPFPRDLLPIFHDLRGFVSENAIHRWSLGVALENGWCYASNNIVLAGAPCPSVTGIELIIPVWVVDFLLGRQPGLSHWAWNDHFLAFKWGSGASVRSSLIDDKFPGKAGDMIRNTPEVMSQRVTVPYKTAVSRIAELSEDIVAIYADKVEGRSERSVVTEGLTSVVPAGGERSLWSAEHLLSIMAVATAWSPSLWPQPVPFRGERIRGYIAGRAS